MLHWRRKSTLEVGKLVAYNTSILIFPFADYMKVIGQAYRELGGDYCYDIIDNATSYYEDLFASGQGAEAKKQLNLCDSFDVDNEKDQWQIFSTIANIFAGIAQYQK